jgi:serine/threonine-protein kinase HipA
MPRCPLTYQKIVKAGEKYSAAGLKRLAPTLTGLSDLPFDQPSLQREAMQRAPKMSIQGVQLKLSAVLKIKAHEFKIVESKGQFILKPQSLYYPHLPENEDLTMKLAAHAGIEVPRHGLVYAEDQSLVYFIRRFDRLGRPSDKVPLEDFAQLAGESRDTKYNASMERVAELIEKYCVFPLLEKQKLLHRTLFNFLVGNEDMHLKNFSLITLEGVVKLSPAYDFLNSSIVLRDPEELALPLKGKKRGITRKILIEYFALERLKLTQSQVEASLHTLHESATEWPEIIATSFLPPPLKQRYLDLVSKRLKVVFAHKEEKSRFGN